MALIISIKKFLYPQKLLGNQIPWPPLPYLAYPRWLALQCVGNVCNCSVSHIASACVCFLRMALHNTTTANTTAARIDRGQSWVELDAQGISLWFHHGGLVRQTWEAARIHNLHLPVSHTHTQVDNVQAWCIDFICIKITFRVADIDAYFSPTGSFSDCN